MCYNIDTVKEMRKMPMTPKEMIKLLESNGFECIRTNGSHKFYKNHQTNRVTTVPFHCKDLKKRYRTKNTKRCGVKIISQLLLYLYRSDNIE